VTCLKSREIFGIALPAARRGSRDTSSRWSSDRVAASLDCNSVALPGGAFLAEANKGADTVTLDVTKIGRVYVRGTVDMVPTPADGTQRLLGIGLGFNLKQGTDSVKNPWPVPSGVTGLWYTVEGAAILQLRLKTPPTERIALRSRTRARW